MKNLHVLKRNPIHLHDNTLGFCIDADNGVLYVVKRCLEVIKVSTLGAGRQIETVQHNLDLTPELLNSSSNEIRLIEFLVESGCILVALKCGLLLRIGVASFSPPSCCFYTHNSEITSVRTSPDQDLIALADSSNHIYIIGVDGKVLQKENVLLQNDSLHKPVGVGWGSKETQFFGLDGRPSKEKQLKEQTVLSQNDIDLIDKIESSEEYKKYKSKLDKGTVIDWRGDGQYLATLTLIPDSSKHYLKVWNRNLELQYISDQLVSLEKDMITWIPNGHFICCAQRRDRHINEIVMFEKNGLVHQRISLPAELKNIFVKDINWSPSSRILAIVVDQFQFEGNQVHIGSVLLLYTMQNFHYYLKFTTKLSNDLCYSLRWNPINHNKLHVMSDNGSYHEYVCNFEVVYSEEHSTVAVIDSNKILVTPMQISSIPPPMAAIILEIPSPIYSVSLNHHHATDMFIFTYDDQLICTNSSAGRKRNLDDNFLKVNQESHLPLEKLAKLTECYTGNSALYRIEDVGAYQNFISIDSERLLASRVSNSGCELVTMTLNDSIDVNVETIAKLDSQIVSVARPPEKSCKDVVFVASDSSVIALDSINNKLQTLFQFSPSLKLNFIELQSIRHKDKISLITLFQDMNLLLNDNICLSTSCTSFRVSENYLIYTTSENLMFFLLLERIWEGSVNETCSQPIEVGANLIIASETDARVVLQMPRGNLEIVHPRVLIFSNLTKLLDGRKFVDAMQIARRQRVNMNFICDYLLRMAESSTDIIQDFAITVARFNPQLLSLFLTELDEDDTILGRYSELTKHLPARTIFFGQKTATSDLGKVQKVCSQIDLPDDRIYLQPKLLSFLKQKPRKTGEALKLVFRLEKEYQREAVEFMLYFIDIDELFFDAIRTYDTDIALMVASVSHKDPKVYLAELNKFNSEENDLLRAFYIDMYTRHYGDAFEKLLRYHESPDCELNDTCTHDELKKLAISKKIFRKALSCFNSSTKDVLLLEELWSEYGLYLLEKRCYLEAGLALSKALELNPGELSYFNRALNCFSLANTSENTFALLTKLADQEYNIEPVVVRLLEENKGSEAIAILGAHKIRSLGGSIEISDAMRKKFTDKLLSEGHWYFVDFIFPDDDKVTKRRHIALHLEDSVKTQISTWTEELSLIKQHFERLQELLVTFKSRAAVEQINMSSRFISDSLSTIDGSETSSLQSTSDGRSPDAKSSPSSIKTRTSTKSNKSQVQRKKRINLKPGSRYEDLALALELRRYILRQKSDEEAVVSLAAGLFEYCYSTTCSDYSATKKQTNLLNDLLSEQHKLRQLMCSLLWPDSPMNEQMFSLYKRFNNLFAADDDEGRTYENEEFEVLMRPHLAKEPAYFEL